MLHCARAISSTNRHRDSVASTACIMLVIIHSIACSCPIRRITRQTAAAAAAAAGDCGGGLGVFHAVKSSHSLLTLTHSSSVACAVDLPSEPVGQKTWVETGGRTGWRAGLPLLRQPVALRRRRRRRRRRIRVTYVLERATPARPARLASAAAQSGPGRSTLCCRRHPVKRHVLVPGFISLPL